jgi:D-amino peptidase
MRVLLQVDMEGAAAVTTHHQIFPCWPEFWDTGRVALTRDVVAVASGLLAGGATEVVIDDQHASGVPNIVADDLPSAASVLSPDEIWRQQQDSGFDAVFQVGRHARRGTQAAFMPHTMLPGMAVAVDGVLVTESHLFGWRAGVPVLGIVGDDKLAAQIDGALAGVPYLAVKRSLGRGSAQPAIATSAECSDALFAFARRSLLLRRASVTPKLPPSFTFAVSLPEPIATALDGQAGLARTGPHSLSLTAEDWWRDAEPALQSVMQAVFATLPPIADGDADELAALRAFIDGWIARDEPAWKE